MSKKPFSWSTTKKVKKSRMLGKQGEWYIPRMNGKVCEEESSGLSPGDEALN